MYIDDCLYCIDRIMHSDITEPLNLSSNELVTINGLVDIVEDIAGIKLRRSYNLGGPRVSTPATATTRKISSSSAGSRHSPSPGHGQTYEWIAAEYAAKYGSPVAA